MNIAIVAEKHKEIMAAQDIYCPVCSQLQYSPFDKLYTKAYERCVDCSTEQEVADKSDNIFAIIDVA